MTFLSLLFGGFFLAPYIPLRGTYQFLVTKFFSHECHNIFPDSGSNFQIRKLQILCPLSSVHCPLSSLLSPLSSVPYITVKKLLNFSAFED